MGGCNGGESFDGEGVSVLCETAFAEDPSTKMGLPSVPTAGNTVSGTDSFVGITDEFGWYQYPSAKTSVTWTVTAEINLVVYACPPFGTSGLVPQSGAVFEFVCLL
jgi:hypothetical protein